MSKASAYDNLVPIISTLEVCRKKCAHYDQIMKNECVSKAEKYDTLLRVGGETAVSYDKLLDVANDAKHDVKVAYDRIDKLRKVLGQEITHTIELQRLIHILDMKLEIANQVFCSRQKSEFVERVAFALSELFLLPALVKLKLFCCCGNRFIACHHATCALQALPGPQERW